MTDEEFLKTLMEAYRAHARIMPWRQPELNGNFDPYKILVSEIMLQQTQVTRVIPKFNDFLSRFPTIRDLADAPFQDVLHEWQGLGYNRRAKYLHEAARKLFDMPLPWTLQALVSCKGLGHNTAAAILTYSYEQRHVFIETNIRTVLIHSFYNSSENVSEAVLFKVMDRLLKSVVLSPREFYWAMMDYGSYLKKQGVVAHRKSNSYTRQSRFQGSRRQLRGEVLRHALAGHTILLVKEQIKDERLDAVIRALESEGLIVVGDNRLNVL